MDESGYGGYDGGCMPMDNIAYISGSEVLGPVPPGDVGEAPPAELSYVNEDPELDIDIKMPKMKFKKFKPQAKPVVTRRYNTNNYGSTFSIVVGVLIGIGIFLILYFFVISD